MTIKQIVSAYKSHQATPCPLTERLVGAGYQQTSGGYIDRAKELSIEINYRKNKPSQYWHLMSYCDKKNESDIFGKSIVCGELIFWMAEVLNCVPKTEMESLLNKIIASGSAAKNGIIVYDRKKWNKKIQNLCFDKIANKIEISTSL